MKAIIRGGTFNSTRCILFFIISLLMACASNPGVRLEGTDFEENLPGQWDGHWQWEGWSGKQGIKVMKIDGSNVQLTGHMKTNAGPTVTEVSGRIDNSILLLTWPTAPPSGCEEEYTMKRDSSNGLILDGNFQCAGFDGTIQLKKVE